MYTFVYIEAYFLFRFVPTTLTLAFLGHFRPFVGAGGKKWGIVSRFSTQK